MTGPSDFTWDKALSYADRIVFDRTAKHLSDLEVQVLRGAWDKETYDEMADRLNYGAGYLNRDIGNPLWKKLSQALDEKVSKVNFSEAGNPAIAQLWGRARIRDLNNQLFGSQLNWNSPLSDAAHERRVEAITDTALTYNLLSDYTAFVAVTEEIRVDPDDPSIRQRVPVETPEGMQLRDRRNAEQPEFVYASPEPSLILGNLLALSVLTLFLWRSDRKAEGDRLAKSLTA